jgi:putative ABC transport system ATP-binding protein
MEEATTPPGESRVILETRDLSRRVEDKLLVDGIDLQVQAGQMIAIVGPSGSGKSSFLRLLNRLDEPTGGTVLLDRVDYRQIPPRELRRRVGMVLQSPFLFPGTVAENLTYGPLQRGETIAEEDIERLLEQVSLAGFAHHPIQNLSGGEAQRVSLARTLANRPDILLLDEPTSSLDEASEREVEQLICQIVERDHLTSLIVTHDMDQALRMAKLAMVMKAGKQVRFGHVEEVIDA